MLKKPPNKLAYLTTTATTTNGLSASAAISTRLKWRENERKNKDPIEVLLDREMREKEHEWSDYGAEEFETKLLVTDAIFDMLLHDTIQSFQICFIKKEHIGST